MSGFKRKAADTATKSSPEKKARSITSFFGQPTRVATKAKPLEKFDKAAWIESLSADEKDLLKLEIDTLETSWLSVLKDTIKERYFLDLKRFLRKEKESGQTVYPKEEDIYSWSQHTPLDKVKVLIIGQDPYHNANQAHGLSFSVLPPTKAPPSLKNIYLGLKKDFPSFVPPKDGGGLLLPWADRGVLMLNACLTVRAHQANSHQGKGWENFTQKVIDIIAQKRTTGVVFMAWGAFAAKRVAKVDKVKHYVINSVHPSPLSAFKGPVHFPDAQCFKKCNDWLEMRYDEAIDWNSVNPNNASLFALKGGKATPVTPKKGTQTPSAPSSAVKADDTHDDEEDALREAEMATSFNADDDSVNGIPQNPDQNATQNATKSNKLTDNDDLGNTSLDIDWEEAEKAMDKVEEKAGAKQETDSGGDEADSNEKEDDEELNSKKTSEATKDTPLQDEIDREKTGEEDKENRDDSVNDDDASNNEDGQEEAKQ